MLRVPVVHRSCQRRYRAICGCNNKNLLAARALKFRFIRILCLKMYTTIMCALFHMNKKTTNLTTYKLTNKDDMNYKTSSKVFVFSWHQYCLKCVKAETSLLHSENLRRWHLWISHAGLSSRGHTARRMRLFEISDMHTYTSVWRHCIIYRFTLLFTATIKREAGREQVGDRRMDESARS